MLLEGYGAGPRMIRLIRGYWHNVIMVCRAAENYGTAFKAGHSVTQGGPLSAKLFNILVNAVVWEWIQQVQEDGDYEEVELAEFMTTFFAIFYINNASMRYDAIAHYADKTNHSFALFCLSAFALSNPVDNIVDVEMVDDNNDYITPPPPKHATKKCCQNKKQSTINPDLSVFGKDGTVDEAADEMTANGNAIGTVDNNNQERR